MATTRFGYLDDLSLKNEKVGIGTSTANERLEVLGETRGGGAVVSGIATLTSYSGFDNTKFTTTENVNIAGGESGPGGSCGHQRGCRQRGADSLRHLHLDDWEQDAPTGTETGQNAPTWCASNTQIRNLLTLGSLNICLTVQFHDQPELQSRDCVGTRRLLQLSALLSPHVACAY